MLNINETGLHKLFRDFHTLTGISVVLLDKDGKFVMGYPAKKGANFCNTISKDEHWKSNCKNCDRINVEACRKNEKTMKYLCHLGLTEVITPIFDSNGIFGYVTFGQILTEDTADETRKSLKRKFDEQAFPGIFDAIDAIPIKSVAQIDAGATVLEAITAYILSNSWVTPGKNGFIRRMDMFIENNLENNITVEDICNEFHLRRTNLYGIAKDYLGCSVASYIRKQRIFHACRMLRETDESISQIAERVGFSDYCHFSGVFRKLMGISATSYRKKHRL
ncbi:MAG: PocR ligand-binding domain-containing protein [Clostridia bacterium]|nr:PocR ligand-binding domain-containing protein [Clostridia bacterium]